MKTKKASIIQKSFLGLSFLATVVGITQGVGMPEAHAEPPAPATSQSASVHFNVSGADRHSTPAQDQVHIKQIKGANGCGLVCKPWYRKKMGWGPAFTHPPPPPPAPAGP